jgi:ribonucleoside-diphosphate reductase alpha chain
MVDYMFRKLASTYLSFDDRLELGLANFEDMPDEQVSLLETGSVDEKLEVAVESVAAKPEEKAGSSPKVAAAKVDKPRISVAIDDAAPLCFNCGNQTQRAGTCYVCTACGSTTGCS